MRLFQNIKKVIDIELKAFVLNSTTPRFGTKMFDFTFYKVKMEKKYITEVTQVG